MCLKEPVDSFLPEVPHAKTVSIVAMDLWVCKVVIHTLDVAHEDELVRVFPCEMTECLWHFLCSFNVSIVVVVFDILPLQVGLTVAQGVGARLAVKLHHAHRQESALQPFIFRIVSQHLVELLRKAIGNCLRHCLIEVRFGDVLIIVLLDCIILENFGHARRMLSALVNLVHLVAPSHASSRKGLAGNHHHALLARPFFNEGIIPVLERLLRLRRLLRRSCQLQRRRHDGTFKCQVLLPGG
mmetsp:Transcript_24473/g.39414  ORF Transcript_24473/g.39414 Transcript_24473/m.39414 type:complete len:241 (+) Transcript_24473:399-1121(+)